MGQTGTQLSVTGVAGKERTATPVAETMTIETGMVGAQVAGEETGMARRHTAGMLYTVHYWGCLPLQQHQFLHPAYAIKGGVLSIILNSGERSTVER